MAFYLRNTKPNLLFRKSGHHLADPGRGKKGQAQLIFLLLPDLIEPGPNGAKLSARLNENSDLRGPLAGRNAPEPGGTRRNLVDCR